MSAVGLLALTSALFVGSHFLLSHPLRPSLAGRLGERGFALFYSLIAAATLFGMVRTYGPASAAAPAPLWQAGDAAWIAATLLMWVGSILFAGSLRRNPAFPNPGKPVTRIGDPRGVFAITRHPMNWGFSLWAIVHAIVNPTAAGLVVSAAILLLALGGSAGQDAKKRRLIGAPWRDWEARTSFVPFGRGFAPPDAFSVIAGTLIWLAASYAHGALGHQPGGIWHWFA